MASLVLAVNPTLAAWGQFAAIIICFYILVFVIIAIAFNLVMAFGFSFLREKIQVIKKLRPTVDSVNKTTEAAIRGTPPSDDASGIARAVASVPPRLNTVDQQVVNTTGRVADAVIEFRARTMQAQAIVKTFLRPRRSEPKQIQGPMAVDERGLEFKSPGYRILMEENPDRLPSGPTGATVGARGLGDGYANEPDPSNGRITSEDLSQYKDVPTR